MQKAMILFVNLNTIFRILPITSPDYGRKSPIISIMPKQSEVHLFYSCWPLEILTSRHVSGVKDLKRTIHQLLMKTCH